MRVAFVSQTGARPGGAEESLFLFLENRPPDIEPIMVLFEQGEYAERLRSLGLSTVVLEVPQRLRAVTRERSSSVRPLDIVRVVRELSRVLREKQIEAVHTNSMKAHVLAAPAARLGSIPVVMHLRDMVDGLGRGALQTLSLIHI